MTCPRWPRPGLARPALALALASLAAPAARADAPAAPADAPAAPAAPAPAPAGDDPDAELRRMADELERGERADEVVEIFDQRPKRPIERGTDVRLTYEQLAARGATDLASALRLLPDVTVRDAGRGGFNIDVRGGRKGSVTVLIDGIAVTDPYYGTFDVSTIPITDIVQIRMSPSPQTPLDGPGGSGGVIEVLTRDAIGPQLVIGRLTGDSLPSAGMAGMARVALAPRTALRMSISGEAGSRDHPLIGAATLDEARHSATGSARLEHRRGQRRVVADGFLDSRHYISPPSDTEKGDILMVDRELSARVAMKGDDEIGQLQLQGQAYSHYLARRSRRFADASLDAQSRLEDLRATRTGGAAVVARPIGVRGRAVASVIASHERATVTDQISGRDATTTEGSHTLVEAASGATFETTRWRLESAAGLAAPIGVDASPWPELKLVAKHTPRKSTELSATGGYKGRVPTLRERFDPVTGNPELDPEKAWHAELRAVELRGDRLRLEIAPFYRRVTGIIRLDPDRMMLRNLDLTNLLGVDAQARVRVHRMIELGGSYNYIRARSDDPDPKLAMAPLDRLPAHRVDGWVRITPDRRVSLLARARYFGDSIDKGMTVPGYTLGEVTLTAPLTPEYLAVLRVDDITNVRPETRTGYHTAGRVISVVIQGSWQ